MFDTPEIRAEKALTEQRFAQPTVGDVFHEMASFWVHVVAVEPAGRVATLGASGPATLPDDGTLRVFATHDAYRKHYGYDKIGGYWVRARPKRIDVTGWFEAHGGWPPPGIRGDARLTSAGVRLFLSIPEEPIAQCPYPRPSDCDGAVATGWLVGPRWHAVYHRDCDGG